MLQHAHISVEKHNNGHFFVALLMPSDKRLRQQRSGSNTVRYKLQRGAHRSFVRGFGCACAEVDMPCKAIIVDHCGFELHTRIGSLKLQHFCMIFEF